MRLNYFLRAPIRADHQGRLTSLVVTETPPAGDPDPAAPYPQTLVITFEPIAGGAPIEIGPLWEGLLSFVPDTTAGLPVDPADATVANSASWPVVGDLCLQTAAYTEVDAAAAFAAHVPLVTPVPTLVRYTKVRLTREFLFTTLPELPRHRFTHDGAVVRPGDAGYDLKRLIGFLAGRTKVLCALDPLDPARDDALRAMPVVEPAPAGTPTVLRISVATRSEECLRWGWFAERPAFDTIAGVPLVPAALNNFANQIGHPAHPSQSVLPALAIFQGAADTAFAPDHGPSTPLRGALAAALAGARRYRRVEVLRPPIPGLPVGSTAQRPYPQYQLCWSDAAGAVASLRLPLSGRAYLPLAAGSHRFWVIPRTADPLLQTEGDDVRLSLPAQSPARAIGLPQVALDVLVDNGPALRLYAHLQRFDAAFVQQRYEQAQPRRLALKRQAEKRWNVDVFDWYVIVPDAVRSRLAGYRALYGYFRESAGRHGLAPEFLQAAFFGEGANEALKRYASAGDFEPATLLSAFEDLGLDLVLYRTGRVPAGTRLLPPELARPGADPDEVAEYAYDLVAHGYLDAATAAAVDWEQEYERREGDPEDWRTLQLAQVNGWAAAIEIVAAELHARLDEMHAYLASKVPPRAPASELERCYLAYARFNTNPTGARRHADHLDAYLRKWTGARLDHNRDVRYNTLLRLATAQWSEDAGTYRWVEPQ